MITRAILELRASVDTFLVNDYVLMSERNLLFRARLLPMYGDVMTKHCVHLYIIIVELREH